MGLISKEILNEVLQHHPEDKHQLLKLQILAIEDTIDKHINRYKYSSDFRDAIDIVLSEILQGKYLGILPLDEQK